MATVPNEKDRIGDKNMASDGSRFQGNRHVAHYLCLVADRQVFFTVLTATAGNNTAINRAVKRYGEPGVAGIESCYAMKSLDRAECLETTEAQTNEASVRRAEKCRMLVTGALGCILDRKVTKTR